MDVIGHQASGIKIREVRKKAGAKGVKYYSAVWVIFKERAPVRGADGNIEYLRRDFILFPCEPDVFSFEIQL
jgi:hypothetical protein